MKNVFILDRIFLKYINRIYIEKVGKIIDILTINPLFIYVFFIALSIFTNNSMYLANVLLGFIPWILIMLMKQTIKRQRPIPRKGNFLHEILALGPDNYSFPSAHTFSLFQLIPIAILISPHLGFITVLYACFVGYSRMYLRFHYFTDVLCGATLGLISGIVLTSSFWT